MRLSRLKSASPLSGGAQCAEKRNLSSKYERGNQHQGTQRADRARERLHRHAESGNGQGDRRAEAFGRHAADRAAVERAYFARGRSGTGQDAGHHDAGSGRRRPFQPDSVHARPAAGRLARYADIQSEDRGVLGQKRTDFRELHSRRRDQPLARESAERAARGDAGTAGHSGRHDLPASRAVSGARYAEPA